MRYVTPPCSSLGRMQIQWILRLKTCSIQRFLCGTYICWRLNGYKYEALFFVLQMYILNFQFILSFFPKYSFIFFFFLSFSFVISYSLTYSFLSSDESFFFPVKYIVFFFSLHRIKSLFYRPVSFVIDYLFTIESFTPLWPSQYIGDIYKTRIWARPWESQNDELNREKETTRKEKRQNNLSKAILCIRTRVYSLRRETAVFPTNRAQLLYYKKWTHIKNNNDAGKMYFYCY